MDSPQFSQTYGSGPLSASGAGDETDSLVVDVEDGGIEPMGGGAGADAARLT